jgi:pyruvate dehydrogenase E1 component alpha subunit
LQKLADAFGIRASRVDGNDVSAVASEARRLVAALRAGEGPQLLECVTHRVRGHFEGDAQKYRDSSDLSSAEERDPLLAAEKLLQDHGLGDAAASAREQARGRVEAAVSAGRGGTAADFALALSDVYTARPVAGHA